MNVSTALQVKNASPGVHKVTGADGLYLKVGDGAGSYYVRYRLGDRRPAMGLGSRDEISLAAAREAATEAVKLARKGIDPIEARRRERAANLAAERVRQPVDFTQATEAYLAAHAPSWKHRYSRMVWLNPVVNYAYPVIGKLPLNDIAVEHIAAIMSAANKRGIAETGRRVRSRIEAVLNAAIAKGERDATRGNPANAKLITAVHPLRRKAGERQHFRRVKFDDAPATFRALREAQGRASGRMSVALDAWLFMISTTARPSEALCARWSEIHFDKKLWTISAGRMKWARPTLCRLTRSRSRCLSDVDRFAPAT